LPRPLWLWQGLALQFIGGGPSMLILVFITITTITPAVPPLLLALSEVR
jgi:hypothetical protein